MLGLFTANGTKYDTYEELSKVLSISKEDKSKILCLYQGASHTFVDQNGVSVTVSKASNKSYG